MVEMEASKQRNKLRNERKQRERSAKKLSYPPVGMIQIQASSRWQKELMAKFGASKAYIGGDLDEQFVELHDKHGQKVAFVTLLGWQQPPMSGI